MIVIVEITTNRERGLFMLKNSIPPKEKTLQDLDSKGRERPWRSNKQETMKLSAVYWRLGDVRKSERLYWCGSGLEFKECDNGHKKLKKGMFCKIPLCATCQWRKARLVFKQLIKVVHEARKRRRVELLHLVLTAKTVREDELKDRLDQFFKAWDRLGKRKVFQKAIVGWYRSLEIKHNMQKGTYHPHFHCILAVKPSYFKSRDYINKQTWVSLWQECMRLDYEPNVYVERVKPKRGRTKREEIENMSPEAKRAAAEKAIAEVAKYATKPGDIVDEAEPEATERAVKTLDKALRKRRLISWGGLFKQLHKELNLTDVEQADLVHDDGEEPTACNCEVCGGILRDVLYRWNVGYSNYIVDERGWTWQEKREEEELKKKKKKDKGADDHTPERVSEPVIVKKQKRNVTAFDLDAERAAKYFEDGGKVDNAPDLATDVAKSKRKPKKGKTVEFADSKQIDLFGGGEG